MEYLEFRELIFGPLVFLGILIHGFFRTQRMSRKDPLRPFYMKGLILKLLGGLAVASIYAFYYKYGDTLSYYRRVLIMQEILMSDPSIYFKIMLAHAAEIPNVAIQYSGEHYLTDRLFMSEGSLFVIKVGSVLGWLGGRSFFGVTLLVTYVSYSGIWALFRLFTKLYPHLIPQMAIGVLYLPSIFFWGSGLLKDPLSLAGLGWLMFSVHQLFFEKKKRFKSFIYIIISCYIIFVVKFYILGAVTPVIFLWLVLRYRKNMKIAFFRILLVPILSLLFVFGVNSILIKTGFTLEQLILGGFVAEVLIKHEYNATQATLESNTGSQYELGDIEPTLTGILGAMPRMVNITLFRPYPWETQKIVQLLSGLESFAILIFTLFLMWKTRILGFFRIIFKDYNLISFFVFTVLFAYLVGISSGTFGSLVRYKIPCLPFLMCILFVIRYEVNKRKGKSPPVLAET